MQAAIVTFFCEGIVARATATHLAPAHGKSLLGYGFGTRRVGVCGRRQMRNGIEILCCERVGEEGKSFAGALLGAENAPGRPVAQSLYRIRRKGCAASGLAKHSKVTRQPAAQAARVAAC